MNWKRTLALSAVAAALAAAGAVAFKPKPTLVEMGRVGRGPMQVTVEATGKTRVRDRFVISAPVSGQMARIELKVGDPVAEGQALARIAPLSPGLLDARTRAEAQARVAVAAASKAESEAAVDRARVARDQADHELHRVRKLAESGAIASEAVDSADFNARARARDLAAAEAAQVSARRAIEAAQATLTRSAGAAKTSSDAVLPSPIKGRILRVLQQSEGPVQAGTPLLEVGDPEHLEIVADFLTTDAVRIRAGARALLDQYGAATELHGRVRSIEPSAFTKISALGVEEQRVNVILDPDKDPASWQVLGDGYQLQVRVVVWEATAVVKAPLSALFRSGASWQAFAEIRGRSSLRTVQVGQRNATEAEVLGGLAEGDNVILHPSDKLESGVTVAAR